MGGVLARMDFVPSGRAGKTRNEYDSSDLRGDTGIGELGFSLTLSADLFLAVGLGVQGYTGTREGVTGSLQVKWEF